MPHHKLIMAYYSETTCYQSALVIVKDHCCRPANLKCGRELQINGHEMLFPRAGVFVKHSGREQIVADPNHVLFFNHGELYRASHPHHGGDDFTTFFFDSETLTEILSLYEPAASDRRETPFKISQCQVTPQLQLEHQRLRLQLKNEKSNSLLIEETALDLFHQIVRRGFAQQNAAKPSKRRETTVKARRELIEAVKLLLARELENSVSLQQVARSVYSSPFHLARLFQAETNLTIHQYQIRLRLILALERLAEQPRNLTHLALELGFSSHSHFTAAFRKTFGISPSAFSQIATVAKVREMRKILTD